ncbi:MULTISPECIES: DUF6427 family protein [unclassified Polaribacter]|uniref:DUF6427 family protein n=1 Tax=unclassified Polaribacter TaxID=196858 RepID=UPI0011BE3394|nr:MULTISPECIES: DUF6427 family protein [unclassified Polaribacter]TXD52426.1 hypothetical protein ES043_08510 [Polaribacter sp. IC063]TXD61063.1 hypothetical protein ES044_05780 [Polaribacter sp. IC066]
MLANFLNKSKPINFITLLILFFVALITNLYFRLFTASFTGNHLLESAILLVLFLVIFFFYNFIIGKNKLTSDNSYAYFFFTLLVMVFLPDFINYQTLLLTIIYLLFVRKIYSLRSEKKVLEKLFDSGFWLGVLCLLEPFFCIFFLLIYMASYLHKKITVHTIFVPIVGFAAPLFVYFTYFFWFDATQEFTNLFNFELIFDIQLYTNTSYFWLICSVLFFTVFAIFFKSIKALSVNNTFRKSWILLIANFIILVFFLLFLPQKNGSELIFILFPISIILANGVELVQKKTLKNIILSVSLIGGIIISFFL